MRTAAEPEHPALLTVLSTAADRGLITPAQRDAVAALAHELDAERPAPPREAARGFNGVTIAYAVGVLLVLFALGWFLVDRWRELGAGGVLAVAVVYVALFAGSGFALRRRGYPVAGGLAITLAVAMTPVWSWAILRLSGEWPPTTDWSDPLLRYRPWIATRWIVLELATLGVALAVARRVRFFALGAPLAASAMGVMLHAGEALGDPRLVWYIGPYYHAVVACALLAAAYGLERRQPAAEDYAFWFYTAGVALLTFAYLEVWRWIGPWRHALPAVGLAFVIASLYLRRRVLLAAGGLALFGYLAYLAFDVFEGAVALPVVLAAFGLAVIAATVWAQRRFPALSARVRGVNTLERLALPGGALTALAPLAIAITAFAFSLAEAGERTREREQREALERRRAATTSRPPTRRPQQSAVPDTAMRGR